MLATNQKTINKPIKLNGVGLHNGVNAELVIKPAPENCVNTNSVVPIVMLSLVDKTQS